MNELLNEQEVLKTARRMSFHMLKVNIINQFKSLDYHSESQDDLGKILTQRSEKLMDIFIQAAWERRPVFNSRYEEIEDLSNDVSLDEYKKQTLETLEKLQKASKLNV